MHIFVPQHFFRHFRRKILLQEFDTFTHYDFRGTGTGSDDDGFGFFEPVPLEFTRSIDKIRRHAPAGSDFHQTATIGTVLTSQHNQNICGFHESLDGILTIGRGVTDVFLLW